MGTLRYTYLLVAVLVLALLSSCSKDVKPVPQESVSKFILGTKADATEGTTFRIMAYSKTGENQYSTAATGTYSLRGKKLGEVPYLTASLLDTNGVYLNEDPSQALAVPFNQKGNEFYIAYVSPGMKHNENGSFTADSSTPFYCSDIQATELNNYGVVTMRNELIDRRAKIGFRFYKDEKDKEIAIDSLEITGAGNTYMPATKEVTTVSDSKINIPVVLKPAQSNTDTLVYECVEIDDMNFILSGIYDFGIKFKLSVNGGGFLAVNAPLTKNIAEILPLTRYIFNITVSNTYIHTILEVTPYNSWEEIEYGFEIEDNTIKIDLGIFQYTNWEPVEWEDNKDIN